MKINYLSITLILFYVHVIIKSTALFTKWPASSMLHCLIETGPVINKKQLNKTEKRNIAFTTVHLILLAGPNKHHKASMYFTAQLLISPTHLREQHTCVRSDHDVIHPVTVTIELSRKDNSMVNTFPMHFAPVNAQVSEFLLRDP